MVQDWYKIDNPYSPIILCTVPARVISLCTDYSTLWIIYNTWYIIINEYWFLYLPKGVCVQLMPKQREKLIVCALWEMDQIKFQDLFLTGVILIIQKVWDRWNNNKLEIAVDWKWWKCTITFWNWKLYKLSRLYLV
jgi:hypothetical protein